MPLGRNPISAKPPVAGTGPAVGVVPATPLVTVFVPPSAVRTPPAVGAANVVITVPGVVAQVNGPVSIP